MKKFVHLAFVLPTLLLIWQQTPRAQYVPPETEGRSKITGKVLDTRGESIRGARVLAYHLSTGKLYTSEPTGGNGEYVTAGLAYGYYDLAIETPDGLFVSNQVVHVAPSSVAAVILTVVPYASSAEQRPRKHPGSDLAASGEARVREKPKGRDFWRSPKGVALLSGVGGAALLAIAVGSESEVRSSIF